MARRLSAGDAVVIGLGSMIGAGVFAAIGPAAKAAGGGLLIGLAVAAVVAYRNAASSAQLAALYPESGGTYVYGRIGVLGCITLALTLPVAAVLAGAVLLATGAIIWCAALRPHAPPELS